MATSRSWYFAAAAFAWRSSARWSGCVWRARAPAVRLPVSATAATAVMIRREILMSGTLLNREDVVGHEAVRLAMNDRRGFRRRRLDQTEDLAVLLGHPVPQIAHVV